jgi:hypothetical protein
VIGAEVYYRVEAVERDSCGEDIDFDVWGSEWEDI